MEIHSHFAIRNARNKQQRQSAGGGAYVFVLATPRKNNSEAKRRQTQGSSTVPHGHGRAWIARRPSIGVPPRLWLRRPNATTQLQFRATRDEAAVGLSPELASLGTAMLLADRS
jgi:hypothetical protein